MRNPAQISKTNRLKKTGNNNNEDNSESNTSSLMEQTLRRIGLFFLAIFITFYQNHSTLLVQLGNLFLFWVLLEITFIVGGWTLGILKNKGKDKKKTKLDQLLELLDVLQTVMVDFYSLVIIFCLTLIFHHFVMTMV